MNVRSYVSTSLTARMLVVCDRHSMLWLRAVLNESHWNRSNQWTVLTSRLFGVLVTVELWRPAHIISRLLLRLRDGDRQRILYRPFVTEASVISGSRHRREAFNCCFPKMELGDMQANDRLPSFSNSHPSVSYFECMTAIRTSTAFKRTSVAPPETGAPR